MSRKETFWTYVKCNSNAMAKMFCEQVVDDPGRGYNPLYICGGENAGKTHLLHGICEKARLENKNTVYLDGTRFVRQVVYGIRTGTMNKLRNEYRQTDFFLLDNIEDVVGRKSSQEELFYTIESLISNGKQVIVTSHIHPKMLDCEDKRLISRLLMGLVVNIEEYSEKERLEIVISLAVQSQKTLSKEMALFLLTEMNQDLKQVNEYIQYVSTYNQEIIEESITGYLSQKSQQPCSKMDCNRILKAAAETAGLDVELLISKSRNQKVLLPRQAAMYLCVKILHADEQDIAQAFRRNLVTVKANLEKIRECQKEDIEFQKMVRKVEKNML